MRAGEGETDTAEGKNTHERSYFTCICCTSYPVIFSVYMHISCVNLLVCYVYFRHACAAVVLNYCHVVACWFRFDVELEVRHRSHADAVRVPAARVVVMVIMMDPPLMGALT